jgi:SAM-dependent methyltransferase
MARIKNQLGDTVIPKIDRQSVESFFQQRAVKAEKLGHVQAVIYQDKNPELAYQRDAAEKNKLLPLLNLSGKESVLDVGCGTGRWAEVIEPICSSYLGTDFSLGLINIASKRFSSKEHVKFLCLPAESVNFDTIKRQFDVIISLGLFIYLNDDELLQALDGYVSVASNSSKILIREPVGVSSRLTILEHFSEDMDQVYNAIYRTEEELMLLIDAKFISTGFKVKGIGDVYESSLNNRVDTKQKWFLLEK